MKAIDRAWVLLRITYGLYFLIIGIDKFFGFVTQSHERVSTVALSIVCMAMSQLLALVGILEIIIGLLFFTRWYIPAAYSALILMLLIVVNLTCMGMHFDIAIHGFVIAMGIIGFIMISKVRSLPN